MAADDSWRALIFGGGFARLLCLAASLLLFVAPANATMRDIASEHLPQSFAQLLENANTNKLILRADRAPCAAALAAGGESDKSHPFLPPAATRLSYQETQPICWPQAATPSRACRTAASATQRAPPII